MITGPRGAQDGEGLEVLMAARNNAIPVRVITAVPSKPEVGLYYSNGRYFRLACNIRGGPCHYICTRPAGHGGPHEAEDSEYAKPWTDDED